MAFLHDVRSSIAERMLSGLIEAAEGAFFTSAAAVASAMPKALKASTEEGFASVMNAGWV